MNIDVCKSAQHAGHTVKLTGELNADAKTIRVSNIAMSAGEKEKKKKEQS